MLDDAGVACWLSASNTTETLLPLLAPPEPGEEYIVRLVSRVITVSIETTRLVGAAAA